jgi:Predicted acyl-CoA transferases/carnitine dehydratase
MTERPLNGIRILDSTVMTAGPWGVQILADLGAEVIKIERPGKQYDVNRALQSVHDTSYYYMCMNKDKKSIQFDYSKPGHKEIFKKLVEKCDIVTENFKAGSMDRQGLGYDDLKQIKPDIIYSAVSGYGQTGPKSALPASDLVIQATSGFMSVNGEKGSTGMKAGSSLADIYASVVSAIALMAGIYYKLDTGKGCKIDTSMQSADMTSVAYEIAKYLNTGEITRPNGNADQEVGFLETVPVADGKLMVEAATDEHFEAFMRMLGLEDLAKDERFANDKLRCKNAAALEKAIFPLTGKYMMAELADKCRASGVPAGEVNTQDRFMRSHYVEEMDMTTVVRDDYFGDCRTLDLPIKFDKFDMPKHRRASQSGQDSAQVLKELLGLSDEEIRDLYSYEGAVEV